VLFIRGTHFDVNSVSDIYHTCVMDSVVVVVVGKSTRHLF
jgi:hypothetical protein